MVNPDFKDILSELSDAGVDFLVIGAHAVILYTEPRYTKDLDVFVRASPESAPRILAALRKFGAPLDDLSEGDFATPGITFQMGLPPNRIDIVTEMDGVTFEEAWVTRQATTYGGQKIFVPSRETLIKNKQASARPQDLLDVAKLQKSPGQ